MSQGPNEILQSRNPDPKFVQSRNLKGYIWHPTSRAYFQYRNSPQFCFQIPNPELQITENPGPEKPIWVPHVAVSPFRLSLPPFPQKRLILRLCVWRLPGYNSPSILLLPGFFLRVRDWKDWRRKFLAFDRLRRRPKTGQWWWRWRRWWWWWWYDDNMVFEHISLRLEIEIS